MAMETRCRPKKSLNFKDTRYKIPAPLAMNTNLPTTKNPNLPKKKKKKNPGQIQTFVSVFPFIIPHSGGTRVSSAFFF